MTKGIMRKQIRQENNTLTGSGYYTIFKDKKIEETSLGCAGASGPSSPELQWTKLGYINKFFSFQFSTMKTGFLGKPPNPRS